MAVEVRRWQIWVARWIVRTLNGMEDLCRRVSGSGSEECTSKVLNVKASIPSVLFLGFARFISVGSSMVQGICPHKSDAESQRLTLTHTLPFDSVGAQRSLPLDAKRRTEIVQLQSPRL